jgi:hypothetical protein
MTQHKLAGCKKAFYCLWLTLAAISGCGGGGSSGSGNSTSLPLLTGKAFHEIDGGACCKPPADTPLPSALLSFHTSTASAEVARVSTDTSGNYSVRLPAGTYGVDLVNRANEPLYNTVEPQQIQVSANTPNQVDIKFVEDVP